MTDANPGDHRSLPVQAGEGRQTAEAADRRGADDAPSTAAGPPASARTARAPGAEAALDTVLPDWDFPPPPPFQFEQRSAHLTIPASSANQEEHRASRRSSRHRGHHSSSTRRKLRSMRILAWLLFAGNLVAVVLIIFGVGQLQRSRTEANTLASQVRQLDAELTRARDRVTEMTTDMRVLLANRIPGVSQLGFGRSLEINERYVRSLTFERARVGADQRIEYSMVVENGGAEPVVPRVHILLFDAAGLQTGSAKVGSANAISASGEATLAPGDARTYTGRIEAARATPPAYFLVEVR